MRSVNPILLPEDAREDGELTLSARQDAHIANEVIVPRDGADALGGLLGRGSCEGRSTREAAPVAFELKRTKVDGVAVLPSIKDTSHAHGWPS